MSTEGHREAAPIARKELHRISDSAFGYLPREQASAADTPPLDAWAWLDSLIKPIATYGALVLGVALLLALILSPYFIN